MKRQHITLMLSAILMATNSFAQIADKENTGKPVTTKAAQKQSDKPELMFHSGFEGTSKVVAIPNTNDYGAPYEKLTGVDTSLSSKNDWDKDWKPWLTDGAFQIQYTGGDPSKRYAQVVPEPGNPKNKVLKFWLDDSWSASENERKARIQANLYGLKPGLKEFYQSVRVFLTDDFNAVRSYPHPVRWLTISEFWNNEWWVKGEKFGFRSGLVLGKLKAEDTELYFLVNAEDAPGHNNEVWRETNTKVPVPIGKWFTMEYYYKEGNAETGRVYLAITPEGGQKQVVYDMHQFTHHTKDPNPDGFTGYNPLKLYTSKELVEYMRSKGKTLQIYWDDFELWKNKRPD
jgi:hypothetical protein